MKTSRQILRWSIPGWLLVFVTWIFLIILFRALGVMRFYDFFAQIHSPKLGVEGTAILAAAGIPLGFITYQIYNFLYNSCIPVFYLVQIDRAREILLGLPRSTLDSIAQQVGKKPQLTRMTENSIFFEYLWPVHRLKRKYRNRKGRQKYKKIRQGNWEIVRCYRSRIALIDSPSAMLADMYHSLGASIVAICFSYIFTMTYLFVKTVIEHDPIWTQSPFRLMGGMIFVTFVFIVLYVVFAQTRVRAFVSSQSFLQLSFYAFFTDRSEKLKTDFIKVDSENGRILEQPISEN